MAKSPSDFGFMHACNGRDQTLGFLRFGVIERHRQLGKFRVRLERGLENQFQFAGFQFLTPGRFRGLPRIAQTGNFTAIERQTHVGGTLVAGHELNR